MTHRVHWIGAMLALLVALTLGVATQEEGGPATPVTPVYDLAGGWAPIVHEDANNRAAGGEYEVLAGLPLNDAAQMRWESFSENQVGLLEFQCRRYLSQYSMRSAHAILWITTEFAPDTQRPIAFNINFQPAGILLGGTRTIYLDGRPHPSAVAPHSFGGFSTGRWDGNMLNVEITHLKSYYTQRPGVPASDERTVTEHWVRHGDFLTMTMAIHDPIFLAEPLVWSVTWARNDGPMPPSEEPYCHASPEDQSATEHVVPFFLPGTNPSIKDVMEEYGVPAQAMRGRPETMYPEYRKQMTQTASSLERCKRRCTN